MMLTLDDPEFGRFTFDPAYDWFACQVDWDGVRVELCLHVVGDAAPVAELARTLWAGRAEWIRRVKGCAVGILLPIKNEAWLEEGDAEVTVADFERCLLLKSISVYPDGNLEFWLGDGDLFWGHSIFVRGTMSGGPTDADIAG